MFFSSAFGWFWYFSPLSPTSLVLLCRDTSISLGQTQRLKSREKCCNVPCGNAFYLFIYIFAFCKGKEEGSKKPTVINTGLNTHLRATGLREAGEGSTAACSLARRSPLGCSSARALPVRNPEDLRLWPGRRPRGPAILFPVPLHPPALRAGNRGARNFLSVWCFRSRLAAYEVPAGAGAGSAVSSHDGRRGPARGAGLAPGPGPGQLSSSGRGQRGSLPPPAGGMILLRRGPRWPQGGGSALAVGTGQKKGFN